LLKSFCQIKNCFIFAVLLNRARSSVGSEHLVYTQGVRGSNPFAPTLNRESTLLSVDFFFILNSKLAKGFSKFGLGQVATCPYDRKQASHIFKHHKRKVYADYL